MSSSSRLYEIYGNLSLEVRALKSVRFQREFILHSRLSYKQREPVENTDVIRKGHRKALTTGGQVDV